MTPFDQSKYARIVAHMLALQKPMSAIEAALASVAGGLEEADINRAIREGSVGRSIASLISSENELPAYEQMQEEQAAGATGFQVLYHYLIGPEAPENWRSGTFFATGPQTVETLRDYAQAAVDRAMANEAAELKTPRPGEPPAAYQEGSLAFEFVVPQF